MRKKHQKKFWISDIEYLSGDPKELNLVYLPEKDTEYHRFYIDINNHLWIERIKPTESQVCQLRL